MATYTASATITTLNTVRVVMVKNRDATGYVSVSASNVNGGSTSRVGPGENFALGSPSGVGTITLTNASGYTVDIDASIQ